MTDWLDAERHADRALEMFERGRWAEAEVELRKALALNPDQPEWHFNLGLTLEASGRDPEAMACYERAVELAPDQVEPMVAAGIMANRLGRFERGVEWFIRALEIEPLHEGAYVAKIESHVRLGDHDEAETTFYLAQQALEEPSAHCLAIIAESLIARRRFERAEWCLKEALRLEPQLPRLRARLAAVYASTDRPQRALQMYLRDLRDDPGNIDTLLDYGELLVDLGRSPEAAEKFRRVLEIEPANVDAHERLGQIALAARRYEQAHLEFELVLKLDAEYPQIRLALADALLGREDRQGARRALLEEVARLMPDAREAARARERSKTAGLEPAPANEPEARVEPAVLDRLGTLLLAADLPAESAQCFQVALEADDRDVTRLRRLAVARFRSGDRAGGVVASRRVLRIDPSCIISIHNLALAALEEGYLRLAAGWIARGLRLDGHDDGVRRLRVRLWIAAARRWVRRFLPV